MYTGYTQLIHSILTVLVLLCTLGSIACAAYVARKVKDVAGLRTLGLDVSELFERQEALQDRFTRFQKREGMRTARNERTTAEDLRREAEAVVMQAGGIPGQPGYATDTPRTKADLYKQRRGQN